MNNKDLIQQAIRGHSRALEAIDSMFWEVLEYAAGTVINSFESGGKLLACGNGGSAADAQHIITEFVVRLDKKDKRKALPAVALTTNTSLLTAAGNDIGFQNIFKRQVEAIGRNGDILLVISTSGNSEDVIRAVEESTGKGLKSIGFLGGNGGKLKSMVDYPLVIPVDNTQRIQEMHIMVGHILCDIVTTHFRDK